MFLFRKRRRLLHGYSERERVCVALPQSNTHVALIFIVRKSFSDTFCSPNTLFEISSVLSIPLCVCSQFTPQPIALCCCYGNRPLSGGSPSPLIYSDNVWLIHSTTWSRISKAGCTGQNWPLAFYRPPPTPPPTYCLKPLFRCDVCPSLPDAPPLFKVSLLVWSVGYIGQRSGVAWMTSSHHTHEHAHLSTAGCLRNRLLIIRRLHLEGQQWMMRRTKPSLPPVHNYGCTYWSPWGGEGVLWIIRKKPHYLAYILFSSIITGYRQSPFRLVILNISIIGSF